MPRPSDLALERLWRQRLRLQPDSGLSIPRFCQKEGISTANFHSWKRRLARRTNPLNAVSSVTSPFVPVILPQAPQSQTPLSAQHLTIRLANGGQILLPLAAGPEMVCQVVETLARFTGPREDLS